MDLLHVCACVRTWGISIICMCMYINWIFLNQTPLLMYCQFSRSQLSIIFIVWYSLLSTYQQLHTQLPLTLCEYLLVATYIASSPLHYVSTYQQLHVHSCPLHYVSTYQYSSYIHSCPLHYVNTYQQLHTQLAAPYTM